MNKFRLVSAFLLAMFVLSLGLLAFPATSFAAPPECPDGFMAVEAGHHHHDADHEHHEGHRHVGLWPNADQNGDGTVCVKHLNQGGQHVHVFIDNIS